MARPDVLTPEVQSRICGFIQAGAFESSAAVAAGIGRTTFYRWLEQGKTSKSGKFRELWVAIEKAREQCRAAAEIEVRKADPKWWLSKRYKEDWGNDLEQLPQGGFHIEIYLDPPKDEPLKAIDVTGK